MQNKLLVKIVTDENPCVQCYYTENLAETLKFFIEAKERQIVIELDNEEEECYIDNISINFASEESILCLVLYTKGIF